MENNLCNRPRNGESLSEILTRQWMARHEAIQMTQKSEAQLVLDDLNQLDISQKVEFLRLFGEQATSVLARVLLENLPLLEKNKLLESVLLPHAEQIIPLIVRAAIQAVKKNPSLNIAEIQALIQRYKTDETVHETIADIEAAKLAKKRNRKPDPKILRRNIQICNLRNKDPKKWTQGKLRKKFGLNTTDHVKKILKQETKWRQHDAELGTE